MVRLRVTVVLGVGVIAFFFGSRPAPAPGLAFMVFDGFASP